MFFTLVDELNSNPKFRSLLGRGLENDATGAIAITLWTMAGTKSRGSFTDGLITRADTVQVVLNHEWADLGAQALVDVGLWHDAQTEQGCETCMQHLTSCRTCRPLGRGEYRFHDWWQRGYDHGVQAKLNIAKKKELQNKALRAQVWARDCLPGDSDRAACRLCGHLMNRQDRKSPRTPTMDHVDPWIVCGAPNLVFMCRECNQKKGQRTPEEAGLVLRPAPAKPDTVAQDPVDSHPQGNAGSPSIRAVDSPRSRDAGSRVDSHPSRVAGSPITVPVQASGRYGVGEEGRVGAPVPGSVPRPSPSAQWVQDAPPAAAPPDQRTPSPLIHAQIREAELSSGARVPVGGSGDGSGSGSGDGPGAGAGRRRRRRRRSRGSGSSTRSAKPAIPQGRAGDVPPVDWVRVPGREGSPFRDHVGPWVDRDEQSMCSKHGMDRPCGKCDEARGDR